MSVVILDTPVVRTAALNYTPSAGADWAILYVAKRSSSSTVVPPTGVTLGGVAMTRLVGQSSGTFNRAIANFWGITRAQIATMSGDAIVVTGGSGTTIVTSFSVDGQSSQAAPTRYGEVLPDDSLTTRTVSFTRAIDSLTVHAQNWNLVATAVTMTPTRIFNASDAGSTHSIGYLTETSAGTATSWSNANVTTKSSYISISFEMEIAYVITSANSGNAIKCGATFTAPTTGFTNVTGGTLGGKALTNVSYNAGTVTATAPAYVDGQTFYSPDSNQDLVLTFGAETATLNVLTAAPNTYLVRTLASPNTTNPKYLGSVMSPAPLSGDKLVSTILWDADTGGSIPSPAVVTAWHWKASDSMMKEYAVTINETSVIIVPTESNNLFRKITAGKISTRRL